MEEISAIKDRILTYLTVKGIKKADFYATTGLSDSNFKGKNRLSQPGGDMIVKILTLYPDISTDWLVMGRGNMLVSDGSIPPELTCSNPEKGENYVPPTAPMDAAHEPVAIPLAEIGKDRKSRPIPLVTEKAVAGFCNGHFSIAQEDVKEYYVIPKFRFCKVDFMIEVSGLSMYPHFNPGDVIACTILTDRKFLQWNKCHVIATREQGILVKRLMPSSHEGCITAVSENKEYPPFDIPMDEITGIALVVGSVSLE